jgi:hypothetical protein
MYDSKLRLAPRPVAAIIVGSTTRLKVMEAIDFILVIIAILIKMQTHAALMESVISSFSFRDYNEYSGNIVHD